MKLAWLAEPTFSILTLLMGAPLATPSYIPYNKDFSFSDMLPVKVFMSILYSIVIKSQV